VRRAPGTGHRSEATRHNLPASLTRFIGREREMAEVKERLRSTRLLTLTGVGGCGKTRLALEVAAQVLAEYTHGVWLVELAALSHPALLPQTVAAVLRVREQPGRSIVEILTDSLRERQALLVLDNCEHLVAACASLAHTLLRSCPHLGILATSRQPLGIAGEAAWPVPPLSLPPPGGHPDCEELTQYESVCLFVDRATQALPEFRLTPREASVVAQVCRRLDGLPLALELAAAWVRALSVEQIAQRLEDRFHLLTGGSRTALPRHQTLWALIAWSYDLLSEGEKRLFRRLSSFVGGFTLEAVQAVCLDPAFPDDPDEILLAHLALEGIASLVDQSLVRRAEARYGMLETIQAYGRELLEVSGEAGLIRRRHAEFFLGLAERAEPELSGPDQAEWLDRLELERDNLRSAIEWSIESGEHDLGLRLGTALCEFWLARWHRAEGREHLTRLLALPGAEAPTAVRARALNAAARSPSTQGEIGAARALIEESVAISRALEDASCLAAALITLANNALSQGEVALARACCEESLAKGRVLGDERTIAWSLFILGNVAQREEADETAWARYEESRTLWEALGDPRGVALALSHLGQTAIRRGEYRAAERLQGESLAIRRTLGDRMGVASSLNHLGDVAFYCGDAVAARTLYEESLALSRELGDRVVVAWLLNTLGRVAGEEGDREAASRFLAEGLLLWRELGDQRWGIAECLEEVGWLAAERGQPERAAELFGAAEALRGEGAPSRVPPDRACYERRVAALGAALGEEAFAAAWAEGRTLTMEQAVHVAREDSSPQGTKTWAGGGLR
jgi:non-specific serine/threonine protein kinase